MHDRMEVDSEKQLPSAHDLAYKGDLSLLSELSFGAFQKEDDSEKLPLHWACSGGHLDTAKFLLQALPSTLEAKDSMGWTPLMVACSAGHLDVVSFLIGQCADVNAANNNRQTSLHYAASKNRYDIAKILLENGADVNARDHLASAPLHRSATMGHTGITQLFVRWPKCAVNVTDVGGNTPLHLACMEGRTDDAILLVKSGAFVDKQNKEEQTPLDVAEQGLRQTLKRMSEMG